MTTPAGPHHGPTGTPCGPARSGPGAQLIDLGTLDWCWSHLSGGNQGTLSSCGPGRSVNLAVQYAVIEEQIVIPYAPDPEVLHLLGGLEVTLGLVGRSEAGLRWVVRVTGFAERSVVPTDPATLAGCRRSHPAQGSPPPGALLLPVRRLRGYHETPLQAPDRLAGS
jgi:hypothetical protein